MKIINNTVIVSLMVLINGCNVGAAGDEGGVDITSSANTRANNLGVDDSAGAGNKSNRQLRRGGGKNSKGNDDRKLLECNRGNPFGDCDTSGTGQIVPQKTCQSGETLLGFFAAGPEGARATFQFKESCGGGIVYSGTYGHGNFDPHYDSVCVPTNKRYQLDITQETYTTSTVKFDVYYGDMTMTTKTLSRVTGPTETINSGSFHISHCPYADATHESGTTNCIIQWTVPPMDSKSFIYNSNPNLYYTAVAGGRSKHEKCPVVGSHFDGSNCWFPNNLGIPSGTTLILDNNKWGYRSCKA